MTMYGVRHQLVAACFQVRSPLGRGFYTSFLLLPAFFLYACLISLVSVGSSSATFCCSGHYLPPYSPTPTLHSHLRMAHIFMTSKRNVYDE